MERVIITSDTDIATTLSQSDTYFVIREDVTITGTCNLGGGCVLDFQGGSFIGDSDTKLVLNGAEIVAGAYCIFNNLDVSGFANATVRAEWFKDEDYDNQEQIYINKALVAANGCPVQLEARTYYVGEPITFPSLSSGLWSTLISPGTLTYPTYENDVKRESTDFDPIIVDINVNNVRIRANAIVGSKPWPYEDAFDGHNFIGTGIRVSEAVYTADIDVRKISSLKWGIVVMPGNPDKSCGVQRLKVNFQQITADCCIYVDIYTNGNQDYANTWFSDSMFAGGRLMGYNGIVFKTPDGQTFAHDKWRISRLVFDTIGLELLNGTPIALENLSYVFFENIRMSENLNGAVWILLQDVEWVQFSINGLLDPRKYSYTGQCDNVVMHGPVYDYEGWETKTFDTIIIDSVWDGKAYIPQLAITKSVQPTNMSSFVVLAPSDKETELVNVLATASYKIDNQTISYKLLSNFAYFSISDGATLTLDMNGFRDFAPCLYNFYIKISNGGELYLKSDKNVERGNQITYFSGSATMSSVGRTLSINSPGYYSISWIPYYSTSLDATVFVAYVNKLG